MKKLHLIGLLFVISFLAIRLQAQPSTLAVFNELKEDFTLVMNGVVINAAPAQHVRVTGLRPSRYQVEARFANRNLPPQLIEVEINAGRETSYALMRMSGSAGPLSFQFLSEFSSGYFPIAPQGAVSIAYDGPLADPRVAISQPTIVPNNVVVVEPIRPNPLPGYTGPIGCSYPMDPAAFAEAKKSIAAKSFSQTKMQLSKQVTSSNCLLTGQVVELMSLFSFESEKLDFAKFAYDFTYDKGNYYKINDAFGFESSVRELGKYLQGK
jgi:Domain of unknown function (DUF4476)